MLLERIQGFLWHIQENVWEHVWAYFWCSVLGLLFVVWPIAAWVGRRRRRKTLRELLGGKFREDKSYVTSSNAISPDEKSRQFAFVDSKRKIIIKADEILDFNFTAGNTQAWTTKLNIITTNEMVPRIELSSIIKGNLLEEIYSRLKAMRDEIKAIASDSTPKVRSEYEKLEDAIRQLTDAVSSLTETVKQLALKDRSDPPS